MTISQVLRIGLRKYISRPSYPTNAALVKNLSKYLGGLDADSFSSSEIKAYVARRKTEGARHATINREVGLLRTLLRDLFCEGRVKRLPLRWHKLRESPRTRVLSDREWDLLVDRLPPWPRDLAILLLGTGCRAGEALALPSKDLDLVSQRFMVERPKEGAPKVVVLVNGALRAAERLATRRRVDLNRIFGRKGKSQRADYRVLRYHLARSSDAVGIEPVTPHDLRRTFASWALRAGADLEHVAQVLGHKDLQTTRRYARIDEGVRRKVASLVGA